ncbi:MAG: nickel-dependent hydrogenase large subunit [Methanosarcinales archaeon]|nr:MAG: nickel-dependent hydrogenase large subunit [Methanosarcinales archaeon]
MQKVVIDPLTRIEGHLRFEADVTDGKVTEAYSSGQLFRGFEVILQGRHPYDAYHFTQRICGVCPVAHATASIRALDMAYGLSTTDIPQNARLIRNIVIAANTIMSHATHFYALWAPDLVNPLYKQVLTDAGAPEVYDELAARFTPFTGTSWIGAVQARKILHEIIAVLGGKMPHHMTFVPGGVTVTPTTGDIAKIYAMWLQGKTFVESQVLGCSVERWLQNKSLSDVLAWLNESPAHANSDLGLLIRYGGPVEDVNLGLHTYGGYSGNEPIGLLSFGVFYDGDGWGWLQSGFTDAVTLVKEAFDPNKITEQIQHSWYEGYEGGKHPYDGVTTPNYAPGTEKYSFIKAPRYDNKPAEVGPLAVMVNDGDPLVVDLAKNLGVNVYTRTLARLHETVRVFAKIPEWSLELIDNLNQGHGAKASDFCNNTPVPETGDGYGLTEAPRGALGHWIKIRDGKIANYQAVVPTTWNCSPKGSNGYRGPAEQAALDTPVPDVGNPVQLGSVVRSFDPCIACAVHTIDRKTNETYELRIV